MCPLSSYFLSRLPYAKPRLQEQIPNRVSAAVTESAAGRATEVAEGEWREGEWGVEGGDAGGRESAKSAGWVGMREKHRCQEVKWRA